jgi:tetratricopeptide (TPR) repeat protein
MKFAIFGIAISTSLLVGHIANAALISSAAQKDPNGNQAAGASNIYTLERLYAANIQIQSLPDGDYLFSELPSIDAQGSNVVIFRKKGNLVAGAEWTNNTGSYACFGATLRNNQFTDVYSVPRELGTDKDILVRHETLELYHYLSNQHVIDTQTKKDLSDCLKSLNKFTGSFKVLSSAQFYKEQGDIYYEKKEWSNAVSNYTQGIELSPRYAAIYYNRGLSHKYLSNQQSALSDLNTAARLYQEQGKTKDHQDTVDIIKAIEPSGYIQQKPQSRTLKKPAPKPKVSLIPREWDGCQEIFLDNWTKDLFSVAYAQYSPLAEGSGYFTIKIDGKLRKLIVTSRSGDTFYSSFVTASDSDYRIEVNLKLDQEIGTELSAGKVPLKVINKKTGSQTNMIVRGLQGC